MMTVNWQRILAATDFSPCGNEAVNHAHALAEQFGAELHVLHITRDSSEFAANFAATGTLEPGDKENESDDWLAKILGETGAICRIERMHVGRDVAHGIADYARKTNIDLIVMATHGRTGLAHVWLGSKTEEVICSAPCPVLVVRPEAGDMRMAHVDTPQSVTHTLEIESREEDHVHCGAATGIS
jgi:universal stress protein A